MNNHPPIPSRPPRRGGALVWLLVALVLLGVAGVVYSFRHELRHGRATPPEVDTSRMEPPLVRRLEERTAAVRAEPYSAEAWGMLGVAYEVHDLFPEGIACYERAQALDPDDFRWPYFLGLCTRLGDQEASLAHLQRAAALNSEHAALLYFVGDGLLGREDLDGAQQAFERALELDPDMVAIHLALAKVALARGDHQTALGHLEDALAIGPQTTEVHSLFVEAHRQAGDREAMLEHAALETDRMGFEPVDDPVRFELEWAERVTLRWRRERAERYLREGRPDEAVAEMLRAVDEDPGAFEAYLGLGHMHFRAGHLDEALEAYAKATETAPDEARAHLGVGAAYSKMQRFDEAIASLERALELDPKLQQARNNLGTILFQRGELDRGLELIEESCKGMPNDVGAHINWAMALRAANRPDEAGEVFGLVTRINPRNTRAHFEYGTYLGEAGRLEEAAAEFRAVIVTDPGRAGGHVNLVHALVGLGRPAEALAACRGGLEHVPDDPSLRRQLAWLYATCPEEGLRDGAASREIAQQLVEETQGNDPEMLRVLAAACAESGDFEAAVRNAQIALDLAQTLRPRPSAVEKVERLIQDLRDSLLLYEAGKAYHEKP